MRNFVKFIIKNLRVCCIAVTTELVNFVFLLTHIVNPSSEKQNVLLSNFKPSGIFQLRDKFCGTERPPFSCAYLSACVHDTENFPPAETGKQN